MERLNGLAITRVEVRVEVRVATKVAATTTAEASSTEAHSPVQAITGKCPAVINPEAPTVTTRVNISQTIAVTIIPTTAAATSINRAHKAPTRLHTSTSLVHQVI